MINTYDLQPPGDSLNPESKLYVGT